MPFNKGTAEIHAVGRREAAIWRPFGLMNSSNRCCSATKKKVDAIIAKTIAMAEEGDTACIRLCLDRITPPRKDRPVRFTLPEMREARDALNASMAIVGVASGELTPSEASELAKVIESYTRTLQAVAFEERPANLGR
jgi:hypothetical protein